jgi:hypothetical protein
MQTKSSHIYILWFIGVILLFGCRKEAEEITEPVVYQVPPEVEIYVERFLAAAEQRNQPIEITNLIVEFDSLNNSIRDGAMLCAACEQIPGRADRQRKITINTSVNCWRFASDFVKEALIFHELGHCVLQRLDHRDDWLPNGDFASLMNSNSISLYDICVYDLGNGPCNRTFKREYYLDELFDPNTPAPVWAQ